MRVWERIRLAYENDQPVEGTLVKKIKGGVVVDLMGVDAFLPGSQIALRRVPNIDELLGQKYEFKIIKLNKRRRNIVVSRRVILEHERAGKREKLMKELEKDQVRKGVVKNITDFGAFIDLGGVDGLLHITDMSWGRISHPSARWSQIGQELEIKVLDIDWERERISLGLKQLQAYPWKDVAAKYPVGTRVQGKVVSITNYGAFIELEPGIEGLVHISEMSWTRNVRHPSKLVSIGETIEAVVLKVDPDEEKISLGMKQTEQDPWMVLPLKYPVGTRINGKVRNLTSFGAFVEIEPGIDGLIHISDMSWTKRVQHPSEVVKKGDAVDVVILNIDSENKRISLGLKQAEEDPWLRIGETYPVGTEMRGNGRPPDGQGRRRRHRQRHRGLRAALAAQPHRQGRLRTRPTSRARAMLLDTARARGGSDPPPHRARRHEHSGGAAARARRRRRRCTRAREIGRGALSMPIDIAALTPHDDAGPGDRPIAGPCVHSARCALRPALRRPLGSDCRRRARPRSRRCRASRRRLRHGARSGAIGCPARSSRLASAGCRCPCARRHHALRRAARRRRFRSTRPRDRSPNWSRSAATATTFRYVTAVRDEHARREVAATLISSVDPVDDPGVPIRSTPEQRRCRRP